MDSYAITNSVFATNEIFQQLLRKARLDWLLKKATGWTHGSVSPADELENFENYRPLMQKTRKYLGLKEVSIRQITGSVGRSGDFDRSFRPRKAHLRERWTRVYLYVQSHGMEPVRLHKIGDKYFVEDGHHRISAARAQGMLSIPAEIWEYPTGYPLDYPQTFSCCPSSASICASGMACA